MENVKFAWNGIKVDGKLYPAYYSMGGFTDSTKVDTITIYGKHYKDLPKVEGLNIQNNTEILTDYFENDKIRVEPTNIHYPQVLEAFRQGLAHNQRIKERRLLKVA